MSIQSGTTQFSASRRHGPHGRPISRENKAQLREQIISSVFADLDDEPEPQPSHSQLLGLAGNYMHCGI